jgi:hypothetical protein
MATLKSALAFAFPHYEPNNYEDHNYDDRGYCQPVHSGESPNQEIEEQQAYIPHFQQMQAIVFDGVIPARPTDRT